MSQPQEQAPELTAPQRRGKKLREARERQGMTQADLAEKSGLSTDTIGRVEGGHNPTGTTLETLADALGVSMATLFG